MKYSYCVKSTSWYISESLRAHVSGVPTHPKLSKRTVKVKFRGPHLVPCGAPTPPQTSRDGEEEQSRAAEQQQQGDEPEAGLLLLHVPAVFHQDERGLVGAHADHCGPAGCSSCSSCSTVLHHFLSRGVRTHCSPVTHAQCYSSSWTVRLQPASFKASVWSDLICPPQRRRRRRSTDFMCDH